MENKPAESGQVFTCSSCGKELAVVPDLAGSIVACPYCWNQFVMPGDEPPKPVHPVPTQPQQPQPTKPTLPKTVNDVQRQPAVSSNLDASCPYIIPKPKRPGGIVILCVMGIFVSLMTLGALAYIKASPFILKPGDETITLKFRPEEIGAAAFAFIYFWVSIGILKGSKFARGFFTFLTIAVTAGLSWFCYQLYEKQDMTNSLPYFIVNGIIFLYILICQLYLRTKRVRNWMD